MRKKILLLTFVIVNVFGCTSKDNQQTVTSDIQNCSTNIHHHSSEMMHSTEPGDESIFNLTSTWNNQENEVVELADLGGRISVLSMVYTHCEYACPRILTDMKAIEDGLASRGIENVNYVLISIDPDRDTPERLKAFYLENELTPNWTLLTGTDESIMDLAMVLGVKFKAVGNSDFSHSNLITILNAKREIMHRQEGLGTNPEEALSLISDNL